MDFAAILVLALVVTGLIWALDAVLWAPRRRQATPAEDQSEVVTDQTRHATAKEPVVVEYARSLFPVILIVLLLRSFLVEPFRIPSGSMIPTLLVGDFILVNKFAYGLRLPVVNWEFIEIADPVRGDIAVFRFPEDPSTDYIKRVVGLPGDRIAYRDKTLYINGEPAPQQELGTYTGPSGRMPAASLRNEDLGTVEHKILVFPNFPSRAGEWVVPAGHYFVMGDNRDNSNDSRVWGYVPEENLVGKAFLIWMNWNGGVQWKRIGSFVE